MAKDLNSLPNPNSRVEEFLEYLAYNSGTGGGAGGTITSMEFDKATNNLTITNSDGSRKTVDLSELKTEWSKLKDVTVSASFTNLVNKAEIRKGMMASNGQVEENNVDWVHVVFRVKPNRTYRITTSSNKGQHLQDGYKICRFFAENGTTRIEDGAWDRTDQTVIDTRKYSQITIPNNTSIAYASCNLRIATGYSERDELMIWDIEESENPTKYIEFKDGGITLEEVINNKFSSDTGLNSTTTNQALDELNEKIRNNNNDIQIFKAGSMNNKFKSVYFRIPSLIRTHKNSLLAFGDVRYNTGSDHSFLEIGCAKSVDNGLSWDYKVAVNNENTDRRYSRVMDTTALVTDANRIILLNGSWNDSNKWTSGTATPKGDWKVFISISDDDGVTWTRKDISSIKPSNTVGFLGGVGTGIQIKEGQYAGRLIMPIQICLRENGANVVRAGCIYSTDNGENWAMSSRFTDTNNSENMIIEVNGNLIMSSRRDSSAGSRGAWISTDGGQTWAVYDELHGRFTHGTAQGSGCQGSWIKYIAKNGDIIGLLSHPKNNNGNWTRDNITVYMYNFTRPSMGIVELGTPYPKAGNADGAGYSSMCYHKGKDGKETLEILFEDNGSLTFKDITYMLVYIDDICMSKGANVSLEGKNEFTGSIEFNKADTSITGNTTLLYQPNKLDDNYYMGYRGHIIEADTYISKVKIAIFSGFTGTTVSKLSVVATEISDSMANDKPYEVLVSEGASYEVKTGEGIYQKYIEVPINKKVRRRGYLLFKVNMGNSDTTRPLRTSRINEDNSEDPLSVHLRHDLVNIHDTNGRLSGTDVSTKKFIMVYEAFGLNINVEKTLINLLTGEYNLGGGISPTSLSLEISDNSLKLKNGNDVISSINFATLEEIDTIVDNIQF